MYNTQQRNKPAIYLDSNCIISFLGHDKMRLFHPFYRTNIIVSDNFAALINELTEGIDEGVLQEKISQQGTFLFANTTEFTIWECMYSNPDFMDTNDSIKYETLNPKDFINRLKDLKILSGRPEPNYLLAKRNALDRFKGNINEQIATESLFRRIPIETWWKTQKFKDNDNEIKETPYKYVQERFLSSYFEEHLKDKSVLEIGCGTGYFTSSIAKYAKHVCGIDYEVKYIDIARSKQESKSNITYLVKDICEELSAPDLSSENFDYIFMIDIFLFLFDEKFQKNLYENRNAILRRIKGLLREDGKIVIVDPHLFWLIPRFGNENRPYGIITEYRQKDFGVTPTLEEISTLFFETGLAIRRIMEPAVDEKYEQIDPMGYNFINQFPQWVVYELIKSAE